MAEDPAMSNFVEEFGMGIQRTESNGYQSKMGTMEVFQTLRDI